MATATTFDYRVRDRTGKIVKGRSEAASQAALVSKLRSQGFAPLDIKEAGTGLNREVRLPGSSRVSPKDVAIMARQFATMTESGLSLIRALSILSAQTRSKPLAEVLTQVRTDVEGGMTLSGAFAKHRRVFPPLMISMTRAGEAGGFLDKTLLSVAANLEAEIKLRAKIKSAMTYPVVVLVFAVLAVIAMLLFIVPVFASMYEGFGAQLPLPTRILMAASDILKVGFPGFIVLGVGAGLLWRRYRHTDRVRNVVDPLKLRLPVFGPLFQKVAISRFSRNLGTMISSGVPILHSLQLVGETSGSVVIQRATEAVSEAVRQGDSMAAPLAQHRVFPPMLVQMLAVGEDTGATDQMLNKVADFYDTEVEATTDQLTSLIEPLMIVFVGAIVGGMVLCLYLPMFGIYDHIQ